MDETGVIFSWGWFWATLLGAVLGFVAGEVIESFVTTLWARRGRKKLDVPMEISESLERPRTKRSLT